MSQVTIYMDEEAIARAKASAAAAKLSLSAWISQLVKEQTSALDANGYPSGVF
jgi:predicted HicB family RNase H-like nuclease